MSVFTIRPAERRDAATLLVLIRELAEAEEFPFPITVTQADLEAGLFGLEPAAEAVLAHHGEEVAGFAVFYSTFATTTGRRGLHLDDLFVRPAFQGRGLGRQLLRHVASIAEQRGCARFEWWALQTNTKAIGFYEAVGARRLHELTVFRVVGQQLPTFAG